MESNQDVKKLYKSRTDRMIDGVCGGVADYFNLDASLVRLAWVLLSLLGGLGIVFYFIAMIVIPSGKHASATSGRKSSPQANSLFWGILLVAAGILWLMSNLGLGIWHHWWGLSWDFVFPTILILAGVAFLFGGRDYVSDSVSPDNIDMPASGGENSRRGTFAPAHRLYLSHDERKIFGVCGGIAGFMKIDPTIVRILFILAAFASFGFMLLLYVIMAIVVPREPATIIGVKATS